MVRKFILSSVVVGAVLILAGFLGVSMYVNRNNQFVEIELDKGKQFIGFNPDYRWVRKVGINQVFGPSWGNTLFGGKLYSDDGGVKREYCWIALRGPRCALGPATDEDRAIFAASPLAKI